MDYGYVTNTKISTKSFQETISIIDKWIKMTQNKYICVCNTHSLVTAHKSEKFNSSLKNADLCIPDGMPLVFALKKLGFKNQERVDGPNLMLKLCEQAPKEKYRIFLYGGKKQTINDLQSILNAKFPGIEIVGAISPPFRNLSQEEKNEIQDSINEANPNIVFVSLGCPKQEIWMLNHKEKINGVMIGVGAAFDFITGEIKRPPLFFQKIGLEWFFRFLSEPKRLFKRYAYNNSLFILNYIKMRKQDRLKTFS